MGNELTTKKEQQLVPESKAELDVLASEDYEYGRSTIYDAIEKAQELLDRAMVVATESEAPHAITVANEVIKTLVSSSEKLIDLQNKFRTVGQRTGGFSVNVNSGSQSPGGPQQAAPVAITMTTRELLSMIKDAKDEHVISDQ